MLVSIIGRQRCVGNCREYFRKPKELKLTFKDKEKFEMWLQRQKKNNGFDFLLNFQH